jgi:hypothetical protein
MAFIKPPRDELNNESDVEQRFTYPLLIADVPEGFGYPPANVLTKTNIRRFVIGKNADQKSYFPDYIIAIGGLPLAVVEAKTPGADLLEAYREARLYSAELNAIHPSGTNPISIIIATDGTRLIAGPSDQASPIHDLNYSQIETYNAKFAALLDYAGAPALTHHYNRTVAALRPARLFKPRKLMGGISIQDEEITHNSFGANISTDFSHIFNPRSLPDRAKIARDGYIPSRRRDRYVDPIDKVIRASAPPSETRSRTLEDTSKPVEIVKSLRAGRALEQQVLLLLGSAGAGKTTFVDHLKEVALPRDLKDKILWLHMNMNAAPGTAEEIYKWFRNEIADACRASESEQFEDLEKLKKLYSVEINAFRKGPGRLYKGEFYDQKLGERLESIMDDANVTAKAFVRYLANERGKLAIIVFDNCDKKNRDEQLLMFDVAQWVQREFKALVILPLREETYDNHRDEAPLDTALKDLVFRIEPPGFQAVLVRRLQLALAELSNKGAKKFKFNLPNGYTVEYPASDQAYFLTSIVRSIFEHDKHIRRLITGLSGRNLRRALEIFLEFCNSGHIAEDDIYKILRSNGQYVLPRHLVTTVLLRMSRRFYDSDASYLKNIFGADERDENFNYFTRLLILKWLQKHINSFGPNRQKGYHRLATVWQALSPMGVGRAAFDREVSYLAKAHCMLAEDFRTDGLGDADLVKLGPAGFVHIHLLGDVSYLAAVSEDTWFADETTARRIAERIRSPAEHYEPATALYNARDVLAVFEESRNRLAEAHKAISTEADFEQMSDLTVATKSIGRVESSLITPAWRQAERNLLPGSKVEGELVSIQPYGLLIEVAAEIVGLAHTSNLPFAMSGAKRLPSLGSKLMTEVLDIRPVEKKLSLRLI